MPSSSIESCAALKDTVPLSARGHTKRPRSRRLANRHRPSPSHQRIFTRSPRRPRKTKSCPEKGSDFKPIDAYQYRDKRGKTSPTGANRELEVLSHAFTKAIEWGYREAHPMIEGKFRKLLTPPRTRYVEDWEIVEALSLTPQRRHGSLHAIRAYIKIKILTGLRRGDLLRLRMTDITSDGIHVQPRKTAKTTGKRIVIEWSDSLRQAVEEAKTARPVDIAPWLFCTRRGDCYTREDGTANAWESMWGRFMERLLAETKVQERFTEHDLRAKCASDADSLVHAQQLLAHADSTTTNRIYRRKPERVKPLR